MDVADEAVEVAHDGLMGQCVCADRAREVTCPQRQTRIWLFESNGTAEVGHIVGRLGDGRVRQLHHGWRVVRAADVAKHLQSDAEGQLVRLRVRGQVGGHQTQLQERPIRLAGRDECDGQRRTVAGQVEAADRQRPADRRCGARGHTNRSEDVDALAEGELPTEIEAASLFSGGFDGQNDGTVREKGIRVTSIVRTDAGGVEQGFGLAAEFGHERAETGQRRAADDAHALTVECVSGRVKDAGVGALSRRRDR